MSQLCDGDSHYLEYFFFVLVLVIDPIAGTY